MCKIQVIERSKDLEQDKRWIFENIGKKNLVFLTVSVNDRFVPPKISISSCTAQSMTMWKMHSSLLDPNSTLVEIIKED